MTEEMPRCPTCRASWRGVSPCPRCGAELEPWLRPLYEAWMHREVARRALLAGETALACREAIAAWQRQHNERGRRLLVLCLLASGRPEVARVLLRPE